MMLPLPLPLLLALQSALSLAPPPPSAPPAPPVPPPPALLAVAGAQDSARLTLAAAVERALATHPSVAAATALLDRAAADLGAARAARRPALALDGGLTRYELPWIVKPLHGFDPRNLPLFDETLLQAGLSLGWTVLDFGSRAARVRAQGALGDAADAALATARRQLTARAVGAYLRVLTARGVLAAHDQRLEALAAASARVRQLVAEGKAARLEQLRVDAELKRGQADRIATAAQLDVSEHELALLADLPYAAVHASRLAALTLADTALAADTGTAQRNALVARAGELNGDVRELRHRARAAGVLLDAARATWLPEVRFGGAYVDRGRWSGDHSAEWQAGLALAYPLYTGGARTSTIQRAAADERIAAAQLRGTELAIARGVDQALAALREAHARVAALAGAVEQSAEVARIERLSLDVGSGTQTQYLDAEANLLRARAGLVEARHAEIAARVELAGIVGELSREWLARTVESSQ
ncbi:MAG TPA: TolC family protein [Gemmatimonadaceae bacterium]|nr:TolC family protein [Gemmatimonadaceae bacterium]